MPPVIGINSHSLIVARAPAATPTVYTDIALLEMSAIPELTRNEFDASVQNYNIDSYILGMPRRKAVQFTVDFIPTEGTHDHLTGLVSAIIANSYDGYKMYQTSSGLLWIASGQVQAAAFKTPTDGKFTCDLTIRFSGPMIINGVMFGLTPL